LIDRNIPHFGAFTLLAWVMGMMECGMLFKSLRLLEKEEKFLTGFIVED
jgi:hypothetical protein